MKKLLTTLLSITLSFSSFASLGPDAENPSLEFGLDEKLNDELKDDQGQVFLYFEFDQNTRTAFKPSEEEYQVANGHPIYWLIAGGMVLGYWAVTNLIDSQERIKQEELEIQKQELEIQKQELELKRQEVEESITFESEESIDID